MHIYIFKSTFMDFYISKKHMSLSKRTATHFATKLNTSICNHFFGKGGILSDCFSKILENCSF